MLTRLFVRGFIALAVFAIPAHTMTIIATFGSSITSDANSAAIEAGILAAIGQIQSQFSDPISVPITFEEGGGLGSSSTSIFQVSYSTYRAALVTDAKSTDDAAALAQLPVQTTSPVDGNTNMWLTLANADALGISHGASSSYATIALNTSIMNFDRAIIDPSKYDLQGVAMHEIDEVLGLGSGLNMPTAFPRLSRPQDLFRYSAAGVRSFTTSGAATSYLSIDGGITDLVDFNQNSGGDYGDWLGLGVPKVQDAFGTPGVIPAYGVEALNLDVIGYDLEVPEPGTLLLSLAGLGLLCIKMRPQSRA
jgi:PEP-CTERM motif